MATEARPIYLTGLKCDWCERDLEGDVKGMSAKGYVIDKSIDRVFCSPGCHNSWTFDLTIARIRMRQEKCQVKSS